MWLVSVHLTQATGQVLRKAGAARGGESGGWPRPSGLRWVLSQDSTPVHRSSPQRGVTGCTHTCAAPGLSLPLWFP